MTLTKTNGRNPRQIVQSSLANLVTSLTRIVTRRFSGSLSNSQGSEILFLRLQMNTPIYGSVLTHCATSDTALTRRKRLLSISSVSVAVAFRKYHVLCLKHYGDQLYLSNDKSVSPMDFD